MLLKNRSKKTRKEEKGVQILGKYGHILEEIDTTPADRLGFIQARLNLKELARESKEQKPDDLERARRQQLRNDFGKQGKAMAHIMVHLAKPKERVKGYKAPVKKDGDKNLRLASYTPEIQAA